MTEFLGLLSLLAFAGLVGFITLEHYFAEKERGPFTKSESNEKRARLIEGLDMEVRALGRRRLRWMASFAFVALLLSVLFFSLRWLAPFQTGEIPATGPEKQTQTDNGRVGSAASLINVTAVPWFGFASLLVIAGVCLILFGKSSRFAKGAGAVTLAAGLTSHAYLIKELKIDKIFGVENKVDLDADIEAYLHQQGWSGMESYPPLLPFVKGQRYLADPIQEPNSGSAESRSVYLARRFQTFCESIERHQRPPSLVLIVGTTDRSPLRRDAMRTFESNFGLARARAEWVREQWDAWEREQASALPKECEIKTASFLTLGAGPVSTPNWSPDSSGVEPPEDRQVDILAFWNEQGQADSKPTFGFHLGHEIESGKKAGKESEKKESR